MIAIRICFPHIFGGILDMLLKLELTPGESEHESQPNKKRRLELKHFDILPTSTSETFAQVLPLQSMMISEEIEAYSCLKYTEILQIEDIFRFNQSLSMVSKKLWVHQKGQEGFDSYETLRYCQLRWLTSAQVATSKMLETPRHQTSGWGPRCAPHRGMPGCGRWGGHAPVETLRPNDAIDISQKRFSNGLEESRISCLKFWIQNVSKKPLAETIGNPKTL